MLPNHRPFVVAEQVAVLAALHPGPCGRSGWGGRSGSPRRSGTRWEPLASADADERLAELLDWLHGRGLTLRPRVTAPPVWLLATGEGLAADGGAAGAARRRGRPVAAGGGPAAALPRRAPGGRVSLLLDVVVGRDGVAARRELLPQAVALARAAAAGSSGRCPAGGRAAGT